MIRLREVMLGATLLASACGVASGVSQSENALVGQKILKNEPERIALPNKAKKDFSYYKTRRNHKAFALSQRGDRAAWGFSVDHRTVEMARDGAITSCNATAKLRSLPACKIIDLQ